MKRTTAAKRIKAHLNDYRERLKKCDMAELRDYFLQICAASLYPDGDGGNCVVCLDWLGTSEDICDDFVEEVNTQTQIEDKLALIDNLEAELDRWAAEEGA